MKHIWVTSLDKDQAAVGTVMAIAKRYGLSADGHFWVDELQKIAWQAALERLADPAVALWVIIGSKEKVPESIGFGLSLLAISAGGELGQLPNVLWLDPGRTMTQEKLPTALGAAAILPLNDPGLGAKLVARANARTAPVSAAYRIAVHANPGYGTWLEVGPEEGEWRGAMFGIDGGTISFQGVGPAGALPQKAVLEHPVQGLKLQLGETEFSAWGVQNRLSTSDSYYVKINGAPGRLLFGPYAADDAGEVFVLKTRVGD